MNTQKFVILPDSTCDLHAETRKKYDIEVVFGHVSYPNGMEEIAMLDWNECSLLKTHTGEEFFAELSKKPNGFTSAPPNIQEFYNAFEKYVKEGYGILSMSISAGMSGTFNFALKAREMIMQKYENAQIECFDSARFGPGYGLMAIYASNLRKEGKSLTEVKEILEQNKNRFHQMGWLDDLSFVAKKGRLSHAKAFMGKLIGIKPLGEFDHNGLTTVIGKAKGEKTAYQAMLTYMEKTIEDAENQIIVVAHTNRRVQAERYLQLIKEKFNPKEIFLNDVYPSCGINVGPGLVAAYYIGKPTSKDLVEEKGLMTSILSVK